MKTLEQRISQIETELVRVRRQNLRLRLCLLTLAVLTCVPFVLGWSGRRVEDFDLVRTRQLQVRTSDGKIMVMIGSTSGGLGPNAGGFIFVNDPSGQTACEIDGYDRGGGRIRLMETGTPNTSANTGLVQLNIERLGAGKAQGVVKLFGKNRGFESMRLAGGSESPGQLSINNTRQGTLVRLGASPLGNGLISVKDRENKSEALLEATATSLVTPSTRGSGLLGRAGTPGLKAANATTGGGGSLTLKGPTGNVLFKAPADAQAAKTPETP